VPEIDQLLETEAGLWVKHGVGISMENSRPSQRMVEVTSSQRGERMSKRDENGK
jgi:hypothetical protein